MLAARARARILHRTHGKPRPLTHVCVCFVPSQAADGLQLGCDCRGDMGIVHRACAERWFARKGAR
jgi:hypothetical protein